jgi:hypothetical protein
LLFWKGLSIRVNHPFREHQVHGWLLDVVLGKCRFSFNCRTALLIP